MTSSTQHNTAHHVFISKSQRQIHAISFSWAPHYCSIKKCIVKLYAITHRHMQAWLKWDLRHKLRGFGSYNTEQSPLILLSLFLTANIWLTAWCHALLDGLIAGIWQYSITARGYLKLIRLNPQTSFQLCLLNQKKCLVKNDGQMVCGLRQPRFSPCLKENAGTPVSIMSSTSLSTKHDSILISVGVHGAFS